MLCGVLRTKQCPIRMGNVDPQRDAETIELEMVFSDLELVEKRLERMELGMKRGKKPDESEKKLLLKCKEVLESEKPLRDADFSEDDRKAMRHLQFMSIRPEVIVLNVAEQEVNSEATGKTVADLQAYFQRAAGEGVEHVRKDRDGNSPAFSRRRRRFFLTTSALMNLRLISLSVFRMTCSG